MRRKINPQPELDLYRSNLNLTNQYHEKYEAVSRILDQNPKILDLVHQDLKEALRSCPSEDRGGGRFQYTSDTALRILIGQIIEGCSFREIIIRIDDSHYLRRFVRIHGGPMMDFTTLCKLKNCMSPETWEKMNQTPAQHAVAQALVDGDKIRLDTTAVETDKGYYQNMSAIDRLEKPVKLVAIAKKGNRTPERRQREADPDFRFAQRFRAGVEGAISFLKRVLGLFRCLNRGWEHYVSTIGAAIFTHNLLILARCRAPVKHAGLLGVTSTPLLCAPLADRAGHLR